MGDTASDVNCAKAANITSVAIPQAHSCEAVIAALPDLLVGSMTNLLNFAKKKMTREKMDR